MIRVILYVVLSTVGAMTVHETHGTLLAIAAWVGVLIGLFIADSIAVATIKSGMWG